MSFPLFPDTSTEPSAAGARRGVCNCIRTTIPLGPPAKGRPGPSDDDDDDYEDGNDDDECTPAKVAAELLAPHHWLAAAQSLQ